MRLVLTFCLFIFIYSGLQADPGPAYIFEVEITHSKGKTQGFVWIGSGYIDAKERIFSNDSLFKDFVLKWTLNDTMDLYQQIYHIDSLDIQIYFKDKLIRILASEIQNIHFLNVIETGFGSSVSSDRYTLADISWLRKKYVRKEVLQTDYCDIEVYFFQQPPESILEKLNDFKEKDLNNDSSFGDFLNELEKGKVLIRWYCSC